MKSVKVCLAGLAASCSIGVTTADEGVMQPLDVVRVGVVAFEAGPGESSQDPKWHALFRRWQDRSGLRFRFAEGTHSDVLHWIDNQFVDVAVLPAGALIQEQKAEHEAESTGAMTASASVPSAHYEYVATFGYPPAATEFAERDRRQEGFHWFSRSVCVVSQDSHLDSQEDLLDSVRRGEVHFLMVHPYSASGSLLPRSVLLDLLGIELPPEQVEYTFSHTESLEKLATSGEGVVAFVHDAAVDNLPDIAGTLKRIDLPKLTEMRIPNEALLVRSSSPHLETLRGLANEHGGTDEFSFRHHDDWQSRYGRVGAWTRGLHIPEVGFESRRLSLDEIGWLLLHSVRSEQQLPRLAVVLSGGGAKCSYQVGVVEALEEKLAAMRASIPDLAAEQRASLDIDLVVGTSGGAINALPVAMGVSRTEEGREAIKGAWLLSDQREILLPPMTQRILLGLWFGLLQIGALMWLCRKLIPDEVRRRWILAGSLVMLGVVQLAIKALDWTPWTFLGTNHLWHHLFLVFTFAVRSAAWGLIVAGAAGLLVQWLFSGKQRESGRAHRVFERLLGVLLVVLPVCGAVHLLFHQKTLSAGDGVEQQIVTTFSKVVETPPDFPRIPRREQLRQLSLAAEGSLQRNLVITGTCLPRSRPKTENELPDDLYFYARADQTVGPSPFGARGVSLNDPRYRHMLLDVVMGSASIFPMFPARVLRDFPTEGEWVELVDGGFAHASPIEAAVEWGATHVIVIETSPESRSTRKNFVANLSAAIGHLYQQTQQVDRRSKQHVRVFTLEPRPPHLCILCFSDNLVGRAICSGYFDAKGTRHEECRHPEHLAVDEAFTGHWFEEDLGPPNFVEVDS